MDNSALAQQLTDKEVAQMLGVSRATIWRWVKAGRIPQPRKIGENSTRWDSREMMEAIHKMAA